MEGDIERTAKWFHLVELHKLETVTPLVKMSALDEVAVSPKPIERQRVSTVLKVFNEKTHRALMHHSGMEKYEGVIDTAIFIIKVLTWWKILNVRSNFQDSRLNDERLAPICDPKDKRLDTILDLGNMALKMGGRHGKREKQLTRDTSQIISHTLLLFCRSGS